MPSNATHYLSLKPKLQEIMLMKQRVEEMEREAKKLRELQAAAEASASAEAGEGEMDAEDDKSISDNRSIYIGNVCPEITHAFNLNPITHLGRLCFNP